MGQIHYVLLFTCKKPVTRHVLSSAHCLIAEGMSFLHFKECVRKFSDRTLCTKLCYLSRLYFVTVELAKEVKILGL